MAAARKGGGWAVCPGGSPLPRRGGTGARRGKGFPARRRGARLAAAPRWRTGAVTPGDGSEAMTYLLLHVALGLLVLFLLWRR